ncbi:N(4)-acetylcytidine aminohydrolase [Vibrio sp. CK2-1]|uniref:N(4)-acetylcytidine aminohydrolase n=1 Tax=Vibrio sp. CK2-1 TaxID=2912249 RepID=UPI001F37BFE4|nr:N(4)-acetylcytidine aminohydrolase [Vibrio sp. CK2-1]MCF7355210.1 N(4)-acetylcytidine aminohydrolase [Vibrio sp. CK2-1]
MDNLSNAAAKASINAVTNAPTEMTFFARFEDDILAGKKTITIRDEAESHYVPGSVVMVSTLEQGRVFCQLQILSVTPVLLSQLTEFHAEQENMTLPQLKSVIQEIYPGLEQLFVIDYQLYSANA